MSKRDAARIQDFNYSYRDFICSDGTSLPVTARCSLRAQNKRVILHHSGTLEVVIPAHVEKLERELSPLFVGIFLEDKRLWIERAARNIAPQIEAYQQSRAAGVPTHLEFPPLGELWRIEYHRTPAARITTKSTPATHHLPEPPNASRLSEPSRTSHFPEPPNASRLPESSSPPHHSWSDTFPIPGQQSTLHLHGPIDNERLCFEALRRFVSAYAKEQLPWFAWRIVGELEAAGQLRSRPASITVNSRNSAWGVCTRDRRICIDRRVLFLPHDLARQVVLHELAHIRNMNHAKAFYDELYSFEYATHEAEKALKRASRFVPAWVSDTMPG